jgi:uncharacterized protein
MLGAARWTVVSALVAGWLLLPSTAQAINPQVRDGGKFFKPDTVKKADEQIKHIEERYKKDVVVETFGEIPEDVYKQFDYKADRVAFYRAWRNDMAKRAGVNGLIVLIVKDQYNGGKTHIETAVGGETLKKAFSPADEEKLSDILAKNFATDPDGRLLDALQFIDKQMAAHFKTAGPANNPGVVAQQPAPRDSGEGSTTRHHDNTGPNILGWICVGLFVIVVVWLIIGLIRAFTRPAVPYGGGPGYGGPGYVGGGYGGGGGFFSGLMGGLFGAVAGNWLYHNVFGGGGGYNRGGGWDQPAYGGEPRGQGAIGGQPAPDDYGQSDQGQGFAGTGRDVDDGGGGGGDAGGGGGGDWSGGDYGGGGDTGGGGGGDWGGGGGGDAGGGGGGGDWGGGGGGGGGDWGGGGGGGGDWGGGGGGGGDWGGGGGGGGGDW